jgi:ferredoxin
MAVLIDKNTCIGCGACAATCPATFALNQDEGKAQVVNQDDAACAKNAASVCPVQAISVE